jgi:hypothetical protein
MGSAAAQSSRSGIQNPIVLEAEFRIPHLKLVIGIVPDPEIPPHLWIFRGEGVKARNLIILGKAIGILLKRISSGLQDQHLASRQSETGRDHTAAGPGADYDVLVFDRHLVRRS